MRGPIDYIVVGFVGNNFKGEILKELDKATQSGAIEVLDVAIIAKDEAGDVTSIEVAGLDDELAKKIGRTTGMIDDEDIAEIADVLENNTSAGLLIIEHLWAKGLKQALIDADGVLVAEGRIHPEAYAEITEKEGA